MRQPIAFCGLMVLLLITTGTFAASPTVAAAGQAEVRLQAWRVLTTVQQGAVKEQLEPLKEIRPGDVVQYEALYVNNTGKPTKDVLVTLPVPEGGLEYLPSAVAGLPVHSASLDGQHFEPLPLRREVRQPDGRRVMQDVPPAQYRFLRWNLGDLPAGGQRAVRARMQLPPLPGASRS